MAGEVRCCTASLGGGDGVPQGCSTVSAALQHWLSDVQGAESPPATLAVSARSGGPGIASRGSRTALPAPDVHPSSELPSARRRRLDLAPSRVNSPNH
ncbi:hypothetical protein NDU88_009332 [Pleurodeles waltl]|uniref:Uncharacterized protein n=1 Tax=Pleurodeles waltl TaxID=8319 RepID=A0AAV7RUX3_PLEWA|nr:hypothetical protein NDU88_009332 [Pleurodeles waltl]